MRLDTEMNTEPKRLMLVDDSAIMRRVIADFLRAIPELEICATAENGKVALDKLRAEKPDLIILDIEMPIMNGLEFLRHAKLKSRAKVIVLSSVTNLASEKASMAIRLGADAIVSKPSGAVSHDLGGECGNQLRDSVFSVLKIH